jgi:hypothetical protein
VFPKGKVIDSFFVDLKKDSDNLFVSTSKHHNETSSGSLSFSSGRDPYFLRPCNSTHVQGISGGLGTDVIK